MIRKHYTCRYCLHVHLYQTVEGCKCDLPGDHPKPTNCMHTGESCSWEEAKVKYTGDNIPNGLCKTTEEEVTP
jgi:hypothetical protein